MGIKPSGDNPIIVPPDNIQSRWGEWEADLDAAGQAAGEVNLETWSLANSANEWVSQNSSKVHGLIEDSAGLGDEAKTIQEQMRELLDPDNPDSQLWIMNDEVNRLQTERADILEEIAQANREDIDRQDKYISRFLSSPGLKPFSDDYFSVTKVGSQWRVEALGTWTGRYTLQSAWMHNGNWEPVINVETVPSDDPTNPRVRYINGAEYSTIINYWVRNAVHKTDDKSTGAFTSGNWVTSSGLRFVAPVTAEYAIFYRVTWGAATYNDNYSFRIQKNGTTIMQWGPKTHVGPIWFLDSGVRKRAISQNGVKLSEGDVLEFQTYSNASGDSQRNVSSSERKISWLMPATQENMEGEE